VIIVIAVALLLAATLAAALRSTGRHAHHRLADDPGTFRSHAEASRAARR